MKPILMLMLGAQVVVLLAIAFAMMGVRPAADRRRARWSRLAGPAVIAALASWQVGERHAADPGAEIVNYGAFLLLGLALAIVFLAIRDRRFGEP